ncbi:MAG: type IV secretion system DNA-binding domain-containing protein [Patescibacteria group bacterium]
MKILAAILGVYLGLIFLVLLWNLFIEWRRYRFKRSQRFSVLEVRVTKNEDAPGPLAAEQIFSTIHAIQHKLTLWQKIKGLSMDQVSFEISHVDRMIRFYVAFPEKLRNLVEGQMYAQYPEIEIENVDDYTMPSDMAVSQSMSLGKPSDQKNLVDSVKALDFKKDRGFKAVSEYENAIAAELELVDPLIYPIKRHPQFEDRIKRVHVDPLAGMTATLAKFNDPHEEAWIQIVVRPLDDKYRILYTKCIRIMKKGVFANVERLQKIYARVFCTRKVWAKVVFFPLYIWFFFQGLRAGSTVKASSLLSPQSGGGEYRDLEEETSKSHERETTTGAAMDKVVRLMFDVNIRMVYVPKAKDREAALVKLREIAGSFRQFNLPHLNGFRIKEITHGPSAIGKYRARSIIDPMVLNNEELATVYHLPSFQVATPNIHWVRSKKVEPPVDIPTAETAGNEGFTLIGETNFRGMRQKFGILDPDRRRHIYIIGKTGMGKSTLLENMVYSDIHSGKGIAVVDPHGDLADKVLDFIPASRTNDVVIFDPSDRDFPISFNMMESKDPTYNTIIASGLVGIFKKIYAESWGPRLEHILRNTILSLLEYPNTTMLGITRILQDDKFRAQVVKKMEDPIVKSFWVNEFDKMQPKFRTEAISPILNKVGQFLSSPIIRNIVGQPKSAVDFRFLMDNNRIVIVNLSKGKIGEDNSALLGAMVITKFQLEAMSRSDTPEKDRKDFYLYVDEFQNFATESFATILSEARKYKLNLTMANQYIAQMPDEVRDAVFGNVGTILSFQVGYDDAEYISQQFGEEVLPPDLVSLSKFTAYTRLLIDNMPSKTFSLSTLPPVEVKEDEGRREKIIKVSREKFTKKREMVEDKIKRWSEGSKKIEVAKNWDKKKR